MTDEKVGGVYYEVDAVTDGLIEAERQVRASTDKMQKEFENTDKAVEKTNKAFKDTTKGINTSTKSITAAVDNVIKKFEQEEAAARSVTQWLSSFGQKTEEVVQKTTPLDDAINKANSSLISYSKSTKIAEQTTTGLGSEFVRLKSSVDPSFASFVMLERATETLSKELRSGSITIDQYNDALAIAKKQSSDFANTQSSTSKGARKLSNSMRQASLQLSQVAQQGSVTGNYFQALAIQLPDLALGFGTLGVLAGAAAGIFAVPLYNAFTSSGDAAEALGENIQKLREQIREASKDVFTSIDEFNLGKETKALEKALNDLSSANSSLRDTARDVIVETTGIDDGFFSRASSGEVIAAARKRIKENSAILQAAQKIENDKAAEAVKDAEGDRLVAIFQAREIAGKRRVDQIIRQARDENAVGEKLKDDLKSIEAADLSEEDANEAEIAAKKIHAARLATIDKRRTDTEKREAKNRIAAKQAEVAAYSQLGGQLTNLVSTVGAEQSAIGKAVFLANQALAVANIIVSTQQAAGAALAAGGPIAGPGLAARVTALGYASAGIAAGVGVAQTFSGRQTGGPVSGGTPYRVNETGPELFTSGGRQYLIPDQNGNVSRGSNAQSGGSQSVTVNVHNLPAGLSAESTSSTNDNGLTVDLIITDITEGGEISRSLQRTYDNLNRRTD